MRMTILSLFILVFDLFAQELPSGDELLSKVIELMNPENSRGKFVQIIETSSGDQRTFEYESFSTNKGEKSLIKYLSPSRVKGNAILMTDYSDNIWMFFRRTNRVRKLASHARKQKFEGSDFTYEDMGAGNTWKEDYTPSNEGKTDLNGVECYLLKLLPKKENLSYSKMLCYVRISDFVPLRIDYYNEENRFQKTLLMENIKNIEGIPTAMKMIMQNHIDGTQTIMEITEITYDVTFDKNFFSERNLKR